MHWINNYLHKPWKAYARGTDYYDCWGLVLVVLQRHFNMTEHQYLDVKSKDSNAMTEAFYKEIFSGDWKKQNTPKNGSIAVCWKSDNNINRVHHVGVYLTLDGGGILNAREKRGVSFDHLSTFKSAFNKVEFYGKHLHSRMA